MKTKVGFTFKLVTFISEAYRTLSVTDLAWFMLHHSGKWHLAHMTAAPNISREI